MEKFNKYAAPLIFTVFCLSLTPWAYNFPLNDDWTYAIGVKNFLEQGRFALCGLAASTQLTHIFSGALFTKIFGFSFAALKFYNLTLATALVFVFFKILEEFDLEPFERMPAALLFCLNPLFLVLANSFMTEITYMFWMLSASYFYLRHLKTGNAAALICAGLCTAAACLTRQLGIALPLAYTLTLKPGTDTYFSSVPGNPHPIYKKQVSVPGFPKPGLKTLVLIWLFPLTAMIGHALWFKYVHGPTWASENYVFTATLKYLSSPGAFASTSLVRLFAVMMETGLLLLPLTAGYWYFSVHSPSKNALRKKTTAKLNAEFCRSAPPSASQFPGITRGAVWLVLAVLAGFIFFNGPLPYLENTVSGTGLGVFTLGGGSFKPSAFFSNPYFWYAMTALSAFSAAVLVSASRLTLRAGGAAARFLFLSAAGHLAISLAGAKFFDRYLLNLLPWFILAAVFAAKSVKFSRPAAAAALVLMAAVSWAGVKDYMQWNRAKWELASKPRPDLPANEIAAGFDYNGWLSYEPNMAYLRTIKPLKLIGEWEWQQVTPYKALISFAQRGDLLTIDQQEYTTPLSSRKGVIYLLRVNGTP